jgi:predicted nucleic acid-binding protein
MTWPLLREVYYAPEVRMWAATFQLMPDASIYIPLNDDVRRLAKLLDADGMKGMDAVHVASAVVGGADVLFTADDDMLKFGATAGHLIEGLRIASPKDFREELA